MIDHNGRFFCWKREGNTGLGQKCYKSQSHDWDTANGHKYGLLAKLPKCEHMTMVGRWSSELQLQL